MSFAVPVATVTLAQPSRRRRPGAAAPRRAARRCATPVSGEVADWPVHDRAALPPGSTVRGPAIIAEDETSTLVGRAAGPRRIDDARHHRPDPGDRRHDVGTGAIQRQVMWNRLIAVVEEQAQTMIRTAFSTTVRESGDLSAGIFDLQGRMLAQAVTGTPGHVNSMMESVGHFLRRFPAATMQPGDHYITNDPWLGTGHLHDLTVVSPAFHDGAHRRAVRQHRARDRHRRPRHGAGGAQRVRGGDVHPDRQVLRRGAWRTRRSSTSCAPAPACRWSWRATSIRCAPATTPGSAGWWR